MRIIIVAFLDIQFTEDSDAWPLLVANFPANSDHIPEKVLSWMREKQSVGIGMMAGVFGDTAPQLRSLCDLDVPGGRPIANFWLVDNKPMCYPAYIIPNFHHRARIAAQDEAGNIIAQDLPPYSLLHSGYVLGNPDPCGDDKPFKAGFLGLRDRFTWEPRPEEEQNKKETQKGKPGAEIAAPPGVVKTCKVTAAALQWWVYGLLQMPVFCGGSRCGKLPTAGRRTAKKLRKLRDRYERVGMQMQRHRDCDDSEGP